MEHPAIVDKDHSYTGESPRKYSCLLCSKVFKTKPRLEGHYKRHSGEKDHVCGVCNKKFFTKTYLYCHSVVNHGLKTKYFCKMCKCYLLTEDMYAEHMRTHAGEKRLYTCAECDKKYKTIAKFKVHRALHFERMLQGSCQICLKLFGNSMILKGHNCTGENTTITSSDPLIKIESLEQSVNMQTAKSRSERRIVKVKKNIRKSDYSLFKVKKNWSKMSEQSSLSVTTKTNDTNKKKRVRKRRDRKKRQGDPDTNADNRSKFAPKPSYCEECGTFYETLVKLHEHMKESNCYGTPGTILCRTCGKQYTAPHAWRNHKREGVCGTKLPTCDVCEQTFDSRTQYLLHKKNSSCHAYPGKVERKFNYTCEKCNRKFIHANKLETHIETCDGPGKKEFICEICNKVQRSESAYNYHMVKHTKTKNFSCPFCGRKFGYRFSLLHHCRTNKACGSAINLPQLRYDPKELLCNVCGQKGFNTRSDFTRHCRSHSNSKGKYECMKCGAGLISKHSLYQHQKYACIGDKACQFCGMKSFRNKVDLLKHMQGHDWRFTMAMVEGVHNYRCEKCEKSFTRSNQLLRHVRQICAHGVMCELCAKTGFLSQAQFRKHMLEHDPNYPVEDDTESTPHKAAVVRGGGKVKTESESSVTVARHCGLCDVVKETAKELRAHMYTVHGPQVQCTECGKSFQRRTFAQHLRTHTGETPYSCPACGKRFKSQANLRYHRNVQKCMAADNVMSGNSVGGINQ